MNSKHCRFCNGELRRTFVDLGRSPLANSFLSAADVERSEASFPLHVYVCETCFLVQLPEFAQAEGIFSDYLYFSSYSKLWLEHCRHYAEQMTSRFGIDARSLVIEVASNDGYLLQFFKDRGISVIGIEPAANVAKEAEGKGITTEVCFFGTETARRLAGTRGQADLMIANNVLAHVPNLHDFVAGFKFLLKRTGTATFEFPHLLNLIKQRQFDTIYHEHYSYFSLLVVDGIFTRHGLRIYDVDRLPTHGGSLRVFVCHDTASFLRNSKVEDLLEIERREGLDRIETYDGFEKAVIDVKCELVSFLIEARRSGKSVVGYGAPAKGNTLLNYCGVGSELLAYTVDVSPHKQGRYLPGVQIPIHAPEHIFETRPDYLLILPWNLKEEIMDRMAAVRQWGGRFVVAIPGLTVFD